MRALYNDLNILAQDIDSIGLRLRAGYSPKIQEARLRRVAKAIRKVSRSLDLRPATASQVVAPPDCVALTNGGPPASRSIQSLL